MLTISVGPSGRRFDDSDVHFVTHPRRPRRPRPRQRRPLLRPRASRARTGRDRRDPAARPAAAAAAAHPGLVGGGDLPAGRRRERDRRRLLRRLPHRRRLDGGDRRRHRPRRQGRRGHRPRPLHAAHRGGADRRPGRRPADAQPRAARPPAAPRSAASPRWRSPKTRAEPVRLAVAGHPPPLLVDGDSVDRGDQPGAGPRRLHRGGLGAGDDRASRPASSWSSSPTGSPRRRDGRAASARSACAPSWQGVTSPALAAQRIEGALHEFAGGNLDDDAAIVAIAPASADGRAGAGARAGAGRAPLRAPSTAATPRRSSPSATRRWGSSRSAPPRQIGRDAPYVGPEGLQRVPARRRTRLGRAADQPRRWSSAAAARCWSAAASTPAAASSASATCPVAWIWELADGQLHPRRGLPRPRGGRPPPLRGDLRTPSRICRR